MYKPMPIVSPEDGVLDLSSMLEYNAVPPGYFSGNTEITSVVLPLSIKEIGSAAFSNCPNLVCFNTGNGVKVIYERFLDNTPNLKVLAVSPMLRLIYGTPPMAERVLTHKLVFDKWFANTQAIHEEGVRLTEEEEDWLLKQAGITRAWVPKLMASYKQGACSYGYSDTEIIANYAQAIMR